ERLALGRIRRRTGVSALAQPGREFGDFSRPRRGHLAAPFRCSPSSWRAVFGHAELAGKSAPPESHMYITGKIGHSGLGGAETVRSVVRTPQGRRAAHYASGPDR